MSKLQSPPRRGGEAAASTKSCEAAESAADGREAAIAIARSRNGGQMGEIVRSEQFRRTDRPGRAVSERIHFYLWRVHPSLCEEGNSLREFNSFTPSQTAPAFVA